jgi:hypothetical protein
MTAAVNGDDLDRMLRPEARRIPVSFFGRWNNSFKPQRPATYREPMRIPPDVFFAATEVSAANPESKT